MDSSNFARFPWRTHHDEVSSFSTNVRHRTVTMATSLWLGLLMGFAMAGTPSVEFDVTPLVPARQAVLSQEQASALRHLPSSRLVWVDLQFSSLVNSRFEGTVDEFVFRIESRRQELQVADYWPKTEMFSSTHGLVQVAQQENSREHAAIRGAAGYPGVGWVDGQASYDARADVQRVFQEIPEMQLMTASGTLSRRTGAFFKLKPTPQTSLEGSHPVRLLLEVPGQWRGDLIEVQAIATGRNSARGDLRTIAQSRFLVAVYQEGDEIAANVARGHAQFERQLREMASIHASEIQRRNQPTPFHKLGQVLEVVDPVISETWLTEVLFANSSFYPNGNLAKLPVDVRVAILDYVDHLKAMDTLAAVGTTSQLVR